MQAGVPARPAQPPPQHFAAAAARCRPNVLLPLPWFLPSELDYEIVVIDDNSPDGTQDVVKQLQQAYGRDRCATAVVRLGG